MREFVKKNFTILLACTLPVALITIVALSTYLPSLFFSTDYNFLYSTCTDGGNHYSNSDRCDTNPQKRYAVVSDKLIVNSTNSNFTVRIFFHDTKKNESREITLEEAQTLTLNGLLTSPDSVTISNKNDGGGGADFFIFYGSSYSNGYYLTKGKSRSKINTINSNNQSYYQDNFQFLGWVLPGRK